jgi:glycosyltransferase involved in cell wall biosynthesis
VPRTVAIAIPCYNEAVTIGKVVEDFRRALPQATILVFDNNSTDESAALAHRAGAVVVRENRQGKGYVMQTILERAEADALIVVDGDDTYPVEDVERLLAPIRDGEADMVVGTRLDNAPGSSFRPLHRLGNRMIAGVLNLLFGSRLTDVLSGYRTFSRRFLSHVPLITSGFETEVEMTIQALQQGMVIREVPVGYRDRPQDSHSKLRTFSDGYQILMTIAVLLRDHRPLLVFGSAGCASLALGLTAGVLRFLTYLGVPTLPESLLSGLLIWLTTVGIALLGCGLVLNSINTRFREMRSLMRRAG